MINRKIDIMQGVEKQRENENHLDFQLRCLKKVKNDIENDIQIIEDIKSNYGDLDVHIDRWENRRLCSKSINPIVDKMYVRRDCGCCADSPQDAYFYIEVNGEKIYSDPVRVYIGASTYCGVNPSNNFEKFIRENNINPVMIDKINEYIKNNPPYDEDDEDDDEE